MSGPHPPRGANLTIAGIAGGRDIDIEPVDLRAADGSPSSGLLYQPRAGARIGVHLMHPRTDQTRNYTIPPLLDAGCMVLARNGRSVNNDADCLHEELLLDVAAGVELLRARGCQHVVLLGNSGGSALAALYQSQAGVAPEQRIAKDQTVAGVDLRRAELPPADAVVLLGGHPGQGQTLLQMIDASVLDETDPLSIDPALDIYDPRNGFRLPIADTRYDPEFVAEVRAGQLRRVERLDRLARAAIRSWDDARVASRALPEGDARLWAERRAATRSYFTVNRTVADPAWIDLTIDPDDRIPGFDGYPRPDVQNYRQIGVAHLVSPRAWLSTWSALSSHSDTRRSIAQVSVPTLVVHYGGDCLTRQRDMAALSEVTAAADYQFTVVRHADHYGRTLNAAGTVGPRTPEATDAAVAWIRERFG
ncbi:MAG: hypothetical protein JWL64_2143 [Frankiales bacterium]|nr:hypothetical protein [Frankiales bacterium]